MGAHPRGSSPTERDCSRNLTVDVGRPCGLRRAGTLKFKPTGFCVKDQKSGDDLWDSTGAQQGAVLTLTAPKEESCAADGKVLVDYMCAGVAVSLGDATIVRKPDLDLCKANCDHWMAYHNHPNDCMTDAQCPEGVDSKGWLGEPKVLSCCAEVAEYMGTVCTMTDAQVTKAKTDAAFQTGMNCATTNCVKWKASASQHGASLAFAFGVSPDPCSWMPHWSPCHYCAGAIVIRTATVCRHATRAVVCTDTGATSRHHKLQNTTDTLNKIHGSGGWAGVHWNGLSLGS